MSEFTPAWETEWKEARGIVDRCDERMHDVRKLGFAFLSALLTAEALAWSKIDEPLPGPTGLVLLFVVLATLAAMRLLEKHSALLQSAAAGRARVLEVLVPVELTDSISDRYMYQGWWGYTTVLYMLFGTIGAFTCITVTASTITTVVSLAILPPYALGVWWIGRKGLFLPPRVDISMDRTVCTAGEPVTFVAINIHNGSVRVPHELLRVSRIAGPATQTPTPPAVWELPTDPPSLTPGVFRSNQALTWQFESKDPGTYLVELADPAGRLTLGLRRMIRVRPAPPPPPKKCQCPGEHVESI